MFTQLVSTEHDFYSLRLMPLMRDKFTKPRGGKPELLVRPSRKANYLAPRSEHWTKAFDSQLVAGSN